MIVRWHWVIQTQYGEWRGRSSSRVRAQEAVERKLSELGIEWEFLSSSEKEGRFLYYLYPPGTESHYPVAKVWMESVG